MDRILVTGASGFIGSHLVPALRTAGHSVIEGRRDHGDVADQRVWQGFPDVEVVVHLAAKSFVPDSWKDPVAFTRTNLLGAIAALDYCRMRRARLVYLSSYMYGTPERLPIPETAPLVAWNPYALSKKLAEEACEFYANSFNVAVTILRPFNVYGPGQSEAFLIPWIVKQAVTSSEICVKDTDPKRDYLYVEDLVEAIVRSIPRREGLGIFNIGSGVSHSVAEVIETIQDVWGTRLPVQSEGQRRKNEIMDTVADASRAREVLGWTPRFSLRQGLEHMHRSTEARS